MTRWYDVGLAPRTWRYEDVYTTDTGDLSPHLATVRMTITVPTGRAGLIESLQMVVQRATVPSTLGVALARARHQSWNMAWARLYSPTPGATARVDRGYRIPLRGGDTFDIVTEDDSTGGRVRYLLGALFIWAP